MLDAKPLLDWTGGPAFAWVVGAALLYWLGGRRSAPCSGAATAGAGGPRPSSPAWRRSSIALDSPIDELAEQLLWVHMVQHILLLVVAPPLLALARPWNRMWHGLPLGLSASHRERSSPRARAWRPFGGSRAPCRTRCRLGSPST